MRRPALRWMMLFPILLTVSVGFVALAIYVERNALADLTSSVDEELVRAERTNLDRLDVESGRASDIDAPVHLILDSEGGIQQQAGNDNPFSEPQLAELAGAEGTQTLGDGPRYRVRATSASDDTTVVTALPLEQVDAAIGSLRRSLIVGGLVIFALESLVVLLIATAVARPVARMSNAAGRIAGGDLDTKIEPPGGSRETADLATDLEHMLLQLRTTIEDREHSAEEARQARDAMQRFLADASHELRTPLTALKGYSDLYAHDMLQEPGALDRAMHRMGSESERLSQLVAALLDLTRHDPPGATNTDRIDLREVLTDVTDDLEAAFPDRNIDLDVDPDAHSIVLGDAGRLHQALINLGANACQHTEPGTAIRIELRSTHTVATVATIDHGPGIEPALADKIFLPFYRADASRSRNGHGGAGLGLAITRQIAEQHGGTVDLVPTPGGGATFSLTLPLEATVSI
ncbi:MAG: HAMP domain-containing sensor histidine kinase [Rubrobacteraceae bacterium]